MYVTNLALENVKAFESFSWKLPARQAPGWHVLLGANGSGKSTLLRAIVLGLVAPEAEALRLNWFDWIRRRANAGSIEVTVERSGSFDAGGDRVKAPLKLRGELERVAGAPREVTFEYGGSVARAKKGVWGPASGWFSASFGPQRRFTGGDPEMQKLFTSKPRVARHLTLFGENVALSKATTWLKDLAREKLQYPRRKNPLETVMAFVNQPGFLPSGMRLVSVKADAVWFKDGNGVTVPVSELSDGYRSILSMTIELLRQVVAAFPNKSVLEAGENGAVFVPRSGVVLIDEPDAHLHPNWQRTIGPWFVRHFPKMQFIVTTHSPLICQAAEEGTVFALAAPGSGDEHRFVEGVERERLLYGDALAAYATQAFNVQTTRSESSLALTEELRTLSVRENGGASMSAKQKARKRHLQSALGYGPRAERSAQRAT